MEVKHFNHEYPLTLSKKKNDDGEEIVGIACCEKIGDSAYSCSNCSFFLHTFCLGSPEEIEFPHYHEHPLIALRLTTLFSKEKNNEDEEEEEIF
ncbi:hypothetical protein ACSBR2_029846 [Camellia fascicularis]